ncbi:MAG: hypothetical protein V1800_01220 [Candidatus Latescibacterota bacterium]
MIGWITLILAVFGTIGIWIGLGRIAPPQVPIAILLGLSVVLGIGMYVGFRRRLFARLTIQDYTLSAMFVGLLYVAVLPWRLGLGRIPFIHPFIYAIPFTAVLIIGLRIVPKPGAATLMIFGKGMLYQLLGAGINPLWWPDSLLQAFSVEWYLLITQDYIQHPRSALAVGFLRGMMGYLYFYFVGAPFIWHTFYAWWYMALQIVLGGAGCLVGAWIGFVLGRKVEAAFRFGGM